MKVLRTTPESDIARVYVAELEDGSRIEFVQSVQPPLNRSQKWVLILSTLKGCPVDCPICDAGGSYNGIISAEEMLAQIDYLVDSFYPRGVIEVEKWKLQFARMGDPLFNFAVPEVLRVIPERYQVTGRTIVSLSTIAPHNCLEQLQEIVRIKDQYYSGGNFQFQFSLHTTCEQERRKLVPVKTLSFSQMAQFGQYFQRPGDQKITLNFAAVQGFPLEADKLARIFSPKHFLIKLTPVNPTFSSRKNKLKGVIEPGNRKNNLKIINLFKRAGYDVILSIGDLQENEIGSNCGMYSNSDSDCQVSQTESAFTKDLSCAD
ncbi:MAG: radical SAM protein [Deltaproteobacteria bacterium]|nr:radical SAM protein [Deltaproteobacteria bacterium]